MAWDPAHALHQQHRIVNLIDDHIGETGDPPTLTWLSTRLGLSRSAIHYHVLALRAAGVDDRMRQHRTPAS